MNQTRNNLSLVVDEVLAEAKTASQRRAGEVAAIKIAEAQPRTEVARGLRSLAAELRASTDTISYADIARTA